MTRELKRGYRNSPNDVLPAPPDHGRNCHRRKQIDDGVVDGIRQDRVFEGVHVAAVDFDEAVIGAALAVKKLKHHHAADVFLQIRIDAGDGGTNAAVGITHLVAENLGREDNEWQHGEGDQRQLPIHAEHDPEDPCEHEEVFEDRDHARGEHFVQSVDVGSNARDESPHWVLVIEGDVHALEVAENLAAQIEHDLLAGPLHVIGLQEFQHEGEDQQTKVNRGDLRHAAQGLRAEPIPQARRGSLGGGEVAVNGDFDQVGTENVSERLQDDRDNGDGYLPAVWTQVGKQPAHQTAVIRFA